VAVGKKVFRTIDATTGVEALTIPTTQADGSEQPGDVVGLNGSAQIDATLLPPSTGYRSITVSDAGGLAAGDLVNIFDSGGNTRVRRASADDVDKFANGYVLENYADAATAKVYTDGVNDEVDSTDIGAGDDGKPVYLEQLGNATTDIDDVIALGTPYIIQVVGYVIEQNVGPTKSAVDFIPDQPVTVPV